MTHKLCGMCNTYPSQWHGGWWNCKRGENAVLASTDACTEWTARENWKPSPPMFSKLDVSSRAFAAVERAFGPEPQDLEGWVYFIQCGDFIKVGYSSNPEARISSLATSNPHPLRLIKKIRGTSQDEKHHHRHLAAWHHAREWFRADAELMAYIRRLD